MTSEARFPVDPSPTGTPGAAPEPQDNRFPPEARFHTRRDYGRVFYRQQKAAGRHLVVLVLPRPRQLCQGSRLGIMVSTKVHKRAVRRHQLKRWVREWFRTQGKRQALGFDVVVLFRSDPPSAPCNGHAQLDQELQRLLPKALAASPQPGSGNGRRKPGKGSGKGPGKGSGRSP